MFVNWDIPEMLEYTLSLPARSSIWQTVLKYKLLHVFEAEIVCVCTLTFRTLVERREGLRPFLP